MRKQWTAEENRVLLALKARKATWCVIAERLERSMSACKDHYFRITEGSGKYIPTENPQTENIKKTCNLCHKPFLSKGKFLNTCDPCKATDVYRGFAA